MDTDTNDIASGLSLCLTRDGQSVALANLPMGGFKHTGVADGSANDDYAAYGQVTTLIAGLSGFKGGLTLSVAGGTGTFGVALGAAVDTTRVRLIQLLTAFTKTAAIWAVGTGNGSLDTGVIANDTWYHVFLIGTTTSDLLISLSPSAPTMPGGYTLKRRIGSMLTDGSGHWLKFKQIGDEYLWDYAGIPVNNTALVLDTPQLVVQQVPTGIQVRARIRGRFQTGNGLDTFFSVTSPDEVDTCVTNNANSNGRLINSTEQGFTADVRTDTSARVNLAATGLGTFPIVSNAAYGWFDPLN